MNLNTLSFFSLCCVVSFTSVAQEAAIDYDKWLKDKFQQQHEELLPVVAVADMFFGCNKARNVDASQPSVKQLITKMGRDELALKLSDCLAGELPNSDTALNFGLIGCFDEQLKGMPEKDKKVKQKLVKQAIAKLSKSDRQKSFTHCVTDQAISYLK
ncbi:hypothetical protein Q4489_01015 [Thalassotalea sp. 1_MG-2023]|uniref:hypothetical protein n=1 Tax=Thalassotalea sp. 1_MG-2023 TaxID=3062680 RepID=UPI0026E24062|nr:hypothetical protein [Thalassotalea sp. 1_MG-2023]MDO6425570.1 hypothetical protein [Thalassotalea sp. 1_MG-2023]